MLWLLFVALRVYALPHPVVWLSGDPADSSTWASVETLPIMCLLSGCQGLAMHCLSQRLPHPWWMALGPAASQNPALAAHDDLLVVADEEALIESGAYTQ